MPTLRLLGAGGGGIGHGGEVFACQYTPDSAFALSAGWDGFLRLWEAGTGRQATAFRVSEKPVSACAVNPEGHQWLSGALDGLLATWDPNTQKPVGTFSPHGRPVAAITFAPNGQTFATASWDRNLGIWDTGGGREGRVLSGHDDIVAGCRFTPSGQFLVSWSYDRTVRLWDVLRARNRAILTGHLDRVTAGAVSPDGKWAVTGGRDLLLALWDLQAGKVIASRTLGAEVRTCLFLLDGATLISGDAHGLLTVHQLPDLEPQEEVVTRYPIQCGDLAPSGSQLALGCEDGHVRFVGIQGLDEAPLQITALSSTQRSATTLQRLFGQSRMVEVFQCKCPVCRYSFELPQKPTEPIGCPSCQRALQIAAVAPLTNPTPL